MCTTIVAGEPNAVQHADNTTGGEEAELTVRMWFCVLVCECPHLHIPGRPVGRAVTYTQAPSLDALSDVLLAPGGK